MRSALAIHDEPAGEGQERVSLLLRAAGEGDGEAWRELLGLYARRVFALARSRCHDDDLAEEITQSVFVTVAGKLSGGEYAERGRFESWLFRIAINRVRDEIRRQRRQADPADPATLAEIAGRNGRLPAAEDGEERFAAMRRALARLGENDQEVIHLRHHAQMSFKQIAELLGEPVGTLLARHHRALRKLRQMIQEDDTTAGDT